MNSIWGYGGVKFQLTGEELTASFYGQTANNSVADARIVYKPVFIRKENISRGIVQKFLGYRVEVEVEILNILSSDYISLRHLVTILNYANRWDFQYSIRVNTGDGSDGILIDNITLISDISFEQLHKLEIGQKIKLKFTKKELVPSMSTLARGDEEYEWVDELNDTLLDENGDKLMII